MPRTILLDTFPLSSSAKPDSRGRTQASVSDQCYQWVKDCIRAGNRVIAPAICYYEALRELERLSASSQIARLRGFCRAVPDRFLSVTDEDLDRAAILWALCRNAGKQTASDQALDADVILAAQAINLGLPTSEFIVATTNPGHLTQFVPCDLWTNITP